MLIGRLPSSLRGLPADVCANVLVDERLWKIVRRFLPNRIPGERDSVNGLGQWIRSKIGVRPSAFRRGVGLEQGHSSKIKGGNQSGDPLTKAAVPSGASKDNVTGKTEFRAEIQKQRSKHRGLSAATLDKTHQAKKEQSQGREWHERRQHN